MNGLLSTKNDKLILLHQGLHYKPFNFNFFFYNKTFSYVQNFFFRLRSYVRDFWII